MNQQPDDMLKPLISNLIMTLDDYYHPNDIAEAVEEVMDSYIDFVNECRYGE